MADEAENLRMLRQVDSKLAMLVERFHDLTGCRASVGDQLVGVGTDLAQLEHRIDRFDEPLARIERRLDLIEA